MPDCNQSTLLALSQITENGTVEVLKSLIFQYRIFEFCLKKANLRQNWLDRPSERVLGEAMPAHGCRGRPETSKGGDEEHA